jgi:hypothetical protein
MKSHLIPDLDAFGITEMLRATREDGWAAIGHVEQERVWTQIDADTWAPFKGIGKSK